MLCQGRGDIGGSVFVLSLKVVVDRATDGDFQLEEQLRGCGTKDLKSVRDPHWDTASIDEPPTLIVNRTSPPSGPILELSRPEQLLCPPSVDAAKK